MPTKVAPLPGTGAGGGGGGGGISGTTKTSTTAARKSRLFNTSHFRSTTTGLSRAVAERGKGYMQAIIFTTCVGLGLLALGIFLVVTGEDKYIVDVMVLGGLCIAMGLGSLVLGCIFALRPACKDRESQQEERGPARNALPPDPSPDSYFNHALPMEDLSQPRPAPSTNTSAPVSNDLYGRDSLGVTGVQRGMLVPPPPPLAKPSRDGEGTTSTVLTTAGADSDSSDVSDVEYFTETM